MDINPVILFLAPLSLVLVLVQMMRQSLTNQPNQKQTPPLNS